MNNKILLFLLLGFFAWNTSSGQNTIDLASLPSVEDMVVIRSNEGADTIIIGMHGGPTDVLYQGDFSFFENISTFSVIEMKQYQHQKPEVMANSDLTLADAIIMNDTSVAMMQKVVSHYNDLDKTVVLMGHSFGAFLMTEYVDDYGTTAIHRIIPMAGRLDMNQEIVDAFTMGVPLGFIDGIQIQAITTEAPPSEWAGMKLAAGVGYNRYTDSLSTEDLSKLMYVYGTADQAVGSLLPNEVEVLENTGATIVKVENGSHGSPFFDPQLNQVLDFIRTSQQMVGINQIAQSAKVDFYTNNTNGQLDVDATEDGLLSIYNLSGQMSFQGKCRSGRMTIELGHLMPGNYIVQFISDTGKGKSQQIQLSN